MGESLQMSLTDRERSERHRQFQRDMEPFTQELARLYNLAPCAGMKYDLKTGEFEALPLAPEWQERIDRVIKYRDEYIASSYPEYQQQK